MNAIKVIMGIFWCGVAGVSIAVLITSLLEGDLTMIRYSFGSLIISIPTLAAIVKDV